MLKVLSLFSGIGAFEKAIERLGIDFELVNFCEIDKYAIESYCAIHGVDKNLNLGDVSVVDYSKMQDVDLIVGGSPCQDFSVAGKQNGSVWTCKDCGEQYNPIQQHYTLRKKCIKCGSENLEKTRSSLLVEYLRAIREKKPRYFVYENVKNIVGKQFKEVFNLFEKELNEYGYNTYWKVLNAKNYGVPQNRERVFVIGIRKDIDNGEFEFPKGFDNGIRLKDILDENIADKYYLSEEVQKRFKFNDKQHENIIGTTKPEFRTIGQRDLVYGTDGVMGCLVATDYKQPKQIIEGFVVDHENIKIREDGIGTCLDTRYGAFPDNHGARTGIIEFNELNIVGELDIKGQDNIKRVYNANGISPTLTTMEGGNRQPKIIEVTNELINLGNVYPSGGQAGNVYDSNGVSPTLVTFTGGGGKQPLVLEDDNNEITKIIGSTQKHAYVGNGEISPTLTSAMGQGGGHVPMIERKDFRIRKLTPTECFALMGFEKSDAIKCRNIGMSDTQLYKQAGNSIVVNVLYYIFKNLFKDYIKNN